MIHSFGLPENGCFFKRCWISFLSAVDSVFSSGLCPVLGLYMHRNFFRENWLKFHLYSVEGCTSILR